MLVTNGAHIPYNPALKERSRELRKNMTLAERKLWEDYLRNCGLTINRQKPLDNYIVDFYCAAKKLVIEVDGEQHYTEESMKYDEERTMVLEGYGLKVIRFSNREILGNFEKVVNDIKAFMNQ